MAASHYRLDNLCAVVDRNRLQISGSTEDVMHHDDLTERFAAFGWNVINTEGNDVDCLLVSFERAREMKGKPTVVIANTTKGCGVFLWNHRLGGIIGFQMSYSIYKQFENLRKKRRRFTMNKIANRQVICEVLMEHAKWIAILWCFRSDLKR